MGCFSHADPARKGAGSLSPVLLLVLVGLVLMTVSAPLFVILGALTALGYVLFGDMAQKYSVLDEGSVVWTLEDQWQFCQGRG